MAGISVYIGGRGALVVAAVAVATAAFVVPVVTGGSGGFSCNSTLSTGASVSSALSSATAGNTICLNAGTYSYADGAITKASTTTVRAAAGVDRDDVTITGEPDIGNSTNLAFKNLSMAGVSMGTNTGAAHPSHLLFEHIHWTGCLQFWQFNSGVWDVTLDGDVVDASSTGSLHACLDDGHFLFTGDNGSGFDVDIGLTLENFDIDGSPASLKCSDGMEFRGAFSGVTVSDNEFHGFQQEGTCGDIGAHTDPLQAFLGGYYSTYTRNYFHDNTVAADLALFNSAVGSTFTNNVILSQANQAVYCGWCADTVFEHNTISGATVYFNDYSDSPLHEPGHSSGVVQNNVLFGGADILFSGSGNLMTQGHNLCSGGCSGTGSITGTPTFVGGATPSTWAGYAITAPSGALTGASDGTSMGIIP